MDMIRDNFSKKDLFSINPSVVNFYLRSHGWQKYGSYADIGNIYYLGNEARQILAPTSSDFRDYADVLFNVINELAKIEERSAEQIYKDLQVTDSDIVRIRIPTKADGSSISLAEGKELVEQSYSLLMSAACSAVKPQMVCRLARNKDVAAYMEQLQMGQTERGSFVLTLLSKIPPILEPDLFEESESFSRKVVRTLINSLLSVKTAIARVNGGEQDIAAFEERIHDGVSANLCEALSKLPEERVDIFVNWALTQPLGERFHCSFSRADKDLLHEAGEVLRRKAPRSDEMLTGFVTKVHSENPEQGGLVTFKFLLDDTLKPVSANFDSVLYKQLIDAHKNHSEVCIEGDLQPQDGRGGWVLTNPRNLEIIPE